MPAKFGPNVRESSCVEARPGPQLSNRYSGRLPGWRDGVFEDESSHDDGRTYASLVPGPIAPLLTERSRLLAVVSGRLSQRQPVTLQDGISFATG